MTKLFSIFKETPVRLKERKKKQNKTKGWKNKAKSKRKKKITKKNKHKQKWKKPEVRSFFLFHVTPFTLKKIWKYRESINVSCKAMDKPFDP